MGKHLGGGKLCVCPLMGKAGFWLALGESNLDKGPKGGKTAQEGGGEEIGSHGVGTGHTLGTIERQTEVRGSCRAGLSEDEDSILQR